jgi:hypothetical protein
MAGRPPHYCGATDCTTLVYDRNPRCPAHRWVPTTPTQTKRMRGRRNQQRRVATARAAGGRCVNFDRCGNLGEFADHIVSLAEYLKEHPDSKDNLSLPTQWLCKPCHDAKTKEEARRRKGRGTR